MGRAQKLIRQFDDPILKTVCEDVAPGEKLTFLDDMEFVCKRLNGCGLAAPQIGQAKRVIFLLTPDPRGSVVGTFMLNPVIVQSGLGTNRADEGCLSFPGTFAPVDRANCITVEYENLRREKKAEIASGFRARVIQHEVDHLNGICLVGDATKDRRPVVYA